MTDKVKEEKRLLALQQVVEQCIDYVGAANYSERERHAQHVSAVAFFTFRKGGTPQWFADNTDSE